ncbi:MAG TPA: PilZ domain-containing protein [Terriglobales bacterium]|nr:PilZ domain-containing protein [Terriglobales bacterium]
MSSERRQFPRLNLSDDAYAIDESGQTLGRVRVVGGGGMELSAASSVVAEQLTVGRRLRIQIIEPASQANHTLDVEVRSRRLRSIGLEFVGGAHPPAK